MNFGKPSNNNGEYYPIGHKSPPFIHKFLILEPNDFLDQFLCFLIFYLKINLNKN